MTIWSIIPMLVCPVLGVLAYRLGVADGLSAGRCGRLAGSKPEKKADLLDRIDAYDGRKEHHG